MKNVTELVENGKHFCILPWIHFHAWPDRRVLPCCVADSNKPVGEIKSNESILEMMNSEEYKKMRLNMLNDEPVEACQRCYDLEKLGTWTMRQSHNRRRGLDFVDTVEDTNDDGSLNEFKLKYMDIRFSNLCNMKCRSCGPSCSSQWAIIITPEHYECLDYWIENGINETIELSYTTNFSSLKFKDKDLIDYWKKFPNLIIWASLDGMGPHSELIRKGTDWDRIEKNLRELKELVPHAQFQITPTISIWNVFQFPKFFDYLIDNELIDKNTVPRFNLATSPWYSNIMILPEFSKEKLGRLYREYIHKYSYNPEISNGFKMISQNLKSGDPNKGGIQEFIKFNDELDAARNESILDVIPELKEVYRWAKN